MKKIGLIGGMSWESTALYYELLNNGVKERLGGLHSAVCVLDSVDFAYVERLQVEGRWDEAGDLLAACATGLQNAGAEVVVLCTNTMHIVADRIEAALSIPFLHLADATAAAVNRLDLHRVALLGTAFTMEKAFYKDRLASHGIDVMIPEAHERAIIHRVIYDELCLGVVNPDSRTAYVEIINRLIDDGAEGVIAGCTEIELLVGPNDCSVPLLRTTQLHVEAALDFALNGE